jgi:S-phase kinase-associated protein 1
MKYIVENKPSEIEKPMKQEFNKYVSKWEHEFINVSMEELEKIINGSNYLNIKSLLNLSCAFLVSKIQNKKIEEIREILNIENDFSPEEEEKIKLENNWISDI